MRVLLWLLWLLRWLLEMLLLRRRLLLQAVRHAAELGQGRMLPLKQVVLCDALLTRVDTLADPPFFALAL